MSEDKPNQPVDTEAVSLADLVGKPGSESEPMLFVEADTPAKLQRKRKPKRYPPNLRLYLTVVLITAVVTILIASAFFLLAPVRVVEKTVPIVVTATSVPIPEPTPTAVFGMGIGRLSYDYLTQATIQDTLPVNTRVRLRSAWFDGQQWHYDVIAQDEYSVGEALESQLAYAPVISDLERVLTPSATPWPFPPSPTAAA